MSTQDFKQLTFKTQKEADAFKRQEAQFEFGVLDFFLEIGSCVFLILVAFGFIAYLYTK